MLDTRLDKNGKATVKCILLEVGATAVSQTALLVDALIPGFGFQVTKVEAYAKTVTAAITFDVLIGATSVLASAITPVADTPTAGTLATAVTALRGTATSELRLRYTSDAAGAATRARVRVWVRVFPLNGESL